jgi:Kunitz/Bovine pancreatic trypsin inhibitor domain
MNGFLRAMLYGGSRSRVGRSRMSLRLQHVIHQWNRWIRPAVATLLVSACGGTVNDGPQQSPGDAAAGGPGSGASGGAPGSGGQSAGGVGGGSSGAAPGGGAGGQFDPFGPGPPCAGGAAPGSCMDKIDRFYFDASSSVCRPFTYTGCGGSENNYTTLAGCESVCVGHRSCSCGALSPNCTADRECPDCPADLLAANETTCSMVGLRCAGSMGDLCYCNVGTGGTASWTCGRKVL